MGRHAGSVEAHNQQLADLLTKIEAGFQRHGVTGSVSLNPEGIQYEVGYALVDLPLEFMQEIERIKRADGIQIRLLDAVNHFLRQWREDGQLHGARALRLVFCKMRDGTLLSGFVLGQYLAGAMNHIDGQTCELRDFDAITFVGRTPGDLP